jgi:hypothetical protein
MVGTAGTASRHQAMSEAALDAEIEALERAVADVLDVGPPTRRDLERRAGAERWGPGRFAAALREAIEEGRVVPGPGGSYGPARTTSPPDVTMSGAP